MNNKQLRSLAKKAVRLPARTYVDKTTSKTVPSAYFVANPNAYIRANRALNELAKFGF